MIKKCICDVYLSINDIVFIPAVRIFRLYLFNPEFHYLSFNVKVKILWNDKLRSSTFSYSVLIICFGHQNLTQNLHLVWYFKKIFPLYLQDLYGQFGLRKYSLFSLVITKLTQWGCCISNSIAALLPISLGTLSKYCLVQKALDNFGAISLADDWVISATLIGVVLTG